ncbi:MAG TPA: superoxide dismutase, partial [Verrucomicrobium sp.]|nr:superoxide dismutase [Verrucomicrobium sp.]
MKRRSFLALAATSTVPVWSAEAAEPAEPAAPIAQGIPLHQEPLPYAPEALEPYIDAATMNVHYLKHHAAYVTNLNIALREAKLKSANAYALIRGINTPPASVTPELRTAIRNNGGGHVNHTMFWRMMRPAGQGPAAPDGKLAAAIQRDFGNFEGFKKAFGEMAAKRFGSGWAWLVLKEDGRLIVTSTANQDNPAMKGIVPDEEFGRPILGL